MISREQAVRLCIEDARARAHFAESLVDTFRARAHADDEALLAADENLQCTIDLEKAGMRPTHSRPSHGNTKNDDISDRFAYVLDEFGATAASVELQLVALSCADKTAKAAAASHRAAEAAWCAIRSAFDMQLSLLSIHAERENMGKAFDEYESSIMVFDELVQQLKQDHVEMPLPWRLPILTAPKIDGLLEGSPEEAETDDLGRLDIMAEMVLNDAEEPEINSPPLKTASTTVWSVSESSYQPAPAWTSVPWSGAQPPSVWNFDPNVSYHRAPGYGWPSLYPSVYESTKYWSMARTEGYEPYPSDTRLQDDNACRSPIEEISNTTHNPTYTLSPSSDYTPNVETVASRPLQPDEKPRRTRVRGRRLSRARALHRLEGQDHAKHDQISAML